MQDMSDKEFDEFFKKTAENYQIPYNPKAWDQMRSKLDKAGGVSGGALRKIITGLALLILLSVATIWYLNNPEKAASSPTLGIQHEPATLKETRQTAEEPASSGYNQDQAPGDLTDSEELADNKIKETFSPSTSGQASRVKEEKTERKEVKRGQTPDHRQQNAEGNKGQRYSSRENEAMIRIPQQVRQEFMEESETAEASAPYYHLTPLQALLWTPLSPFGAWATVDIQKTEVMEESQPENHPNQNLEAHEVQPEKTPFHRAGLSFTVSPDFSAIGLTRISQMGTKSGIGLEFFIFRNLSLYTGFMLSHKVYSATGGYEPTPGFWKYRKKPVNIDAECKVLDVPVNLRYYGLSWEKSRLYISSGLSSYLMLKEEYQYDYADYDPKDYHFHSVRNKNHHYFKVVNIAAGYERALGRQWALQAEPFVQVPLAGVGEGKVKLSTLGMYFTVNYRLGLSRSSYNR